MWHRGWGDQSEVVVVVTSGRVPHWRTALWETEGADPPPDRCKGSVCTPALVSGWHCLPLLCWTLVSHFPVQSWGKEMRESSVMGFLVHIKSISWNRNPCKKKKKTLHALTHDVFKMLSGHKLSYQVDIAELIEPEVVDGGGDGWKVVGLETSVTETNSSTQPGQNPPVWYALLSTQLRRSNDVERRNIFIQ